MLVLSRKIKESIMIGEEIEIKVLAIEGDQVKLGVEAPKSVDIYRKEIYVAIKEENSEAAEISQDMVELLKNQS
ncbi:MAG TPA: carbon storage regulator CsrA [Bacillota bacterium]|nr:carbon storage regulator CsrA [Bacillota bacterium]